MRFFRRAWEQVRGDKFDGWGTAVYFFETDDELWPQRQLEVYADGNVLAYDKTHVDDEFGGLSQAALEASDFKPFEIAQDDFDSAWKESRPLNRAPAP